MNTAATLQLPRTKITKYKFDQNGSLILRDSLGGHDWPVVYILDGEEGKKKVAYVGETGNAYNRMLQHLSNPKREVMMNEYVFYNETFNKSAILDLENMLIEHMYVDGVFELQNQNGGQSKTHNYYQRGLYREIFKDVWAQMRTRKLAKKTLIEIENSKVFKYSPFKQLTDEQYDLQIRLAETVADAMKKDERQDIIVEGGAGTGKSVLAISLIKYLVDVTSLNSDYRDLNNLEDVEEATNFIRLNAQLGAFKDLSIALVAPMQEFRETVSSVLKGIKILKCVDVVSPTELTKKEGGYDIVLVDEAHRLGTYARSTNHVAYQKGCARLGFADYEKTTQLDWAKKQAKHALILFYDPKQSVSGVDVSREDFQNALDGEGVIRYSMRNQVRLIAGGAYIDFWKRLLYNETKELAPDFSSSGYEFKIFDDCAEMMEEIKEKDEECGGLCRVMSGYGFNYNKKMRDKKGENANQDYDFMIDGVPYSWNGLNEGFATDPKSKDLVGSVHTCQGFDFNYAGVIFAPDIYFDKESGTIQTAPENYLDKKGKIADDEERTSENILNAYLVLLTRGIKGTFVYCCDPALREYLKEKFGI